MSSSYKYRTDTPRTFLKIADKVLRGGNNTLNHRRILGNKIT